MASGEADGDAIEGKDSAEKEEAADQRVMRTPKRRMSHPSHTENAGIRFPLSYTAARHVRFKTPISETVGKTTPSKIAHPGGECDEPKK